MKVLIFVISMLASTPSFGLQFATGMDESQWVNDASPFVCRLEHYVSGFGTGALVHWAGENRTIELDGQGLRFGSKMIEVISQPPNWKPLGVPMGLTRVPAIEGELRVEDLITARIVKALYLGRMVTFLGSLQDDEEQVLEVTLSTVGFRQAFDQFTECEEALVATNFSQVERTRIQYATGQIELDDQAKRKLDKIIEFLAADPSVEQIFIDGHTDDAGLIKDNVKMSQLRAQRAQQYFLDAGIDPNMLVVRYHAGKYPVVPNTNTGNRAKNRRTTIRLSREFEPQAPAPLEEQSLRQAATVDGDESLDLSDSSEAQDISATVER